MFTNIKNNRLCISTIFNILNISNCNDCDEKYNNTNFTEKEFDKYFKKCTPVKTVNISKNNDKFYEGYYFNNSYNLNLIKYNNYKLHHHDIYYYSFFENENITYSDYYDFIKTILLRNIKKSSLMPSHIFKKYCDNAMEIFSDERFKNLPFDFDSTIKKLIDKNNEFFLVCPTEIKNNLIDYYLDCLENSEKIENLANHYTQMWKFILIENQLNFLEKNNIEKYKTHIKKNPSLIMFCKKTYFEEYFTKDELKEIIRKKNCDFRMLNIDQFIHKFKYSIDNYFDIESIKKIILKKGLVNTKHNYYDFYFSEKELDEIFSEKIIFDLKYLTYFDIYMYKIKNFLTQINNVPLSILSKYLVVLLNDDNAIYEINKLVDIKHIESSVLTQALILAIKDNKNVYKYINGSNYNTINSKFDKIKVLTEMKTNNIEISVVDEIYLFFNLQNKKSM